MRLEASGTGGGDFVVVGVVVDGGGRRVIRGFGETKWWAWGREVGEVKAVSMLCVRWEEYRRALCWTEMTKERKQEEPKRVCMWKQTHEWRR